MEKITVPEITTSRLRLRRLNREDAPLFFTRLAGSPEVTRYMLWQTHEDPGQSIASIEKTLARYEEGSCCRWAIALKETDELIGIIDLLSFEEKGQSCSFAYMLADAFWGRGFGTEALKAVLHFAFTELSILSITADHMAENPASGAVMRKAGMTYVNTIPGKYVKDGIRHDAHRYRITRDQWLRES